MPLRCRRAADLLALVLLAVGGPAGAAEAAKAHAYRDRNFDYFVSGDPSAPRAAHTDAGYALMGGGGNNDNAWRFLATHAGRGHFVILRAVSDDSYDPDDGNYGELLQKRWGGVASAETIVFHNREASADPRVIKVVREADGIFLAGGDQSNYVRYWKGTPVGDALNEHVRAGRPIGGSSAGLAVLGRYSYTAFDGGSMESRVALADPFDPGVTLENDFLHLPLLENVITDTHFSKRCRLGRLITFVARLNKEQDHTVFGIGVDEKTALLVDADGSARLAKGSVGSAWIVRPQRAASTLIAKQALYIDDLWLIRMDERSSVDVRDGTIRNPAAEAILSVRGGELLRPSIATPMFKRDKVPGGED